MSSKNSDNYANYSHEPVMLEEIMEYINLFSGGYYIDCTSGGGGHGEEILKRTSPAGKLLAVDRDPDAVDVSSRRFARYGDRCAVVQANFRELPRLVQGAEIAGADGVLMDLGVSSFQLDTPGRGFSYNEDAPLDMRMDPAQEETAADLINRASEKELTEIIRKYGEEKWASRIAKFIVREREFRPVKTTGQLVEIVKAAIPAKARRSGPHPAKRTFQALRIALNEELDNLKEGIKNAVNVLNPGGRLCIISFHSLEDRIVKDTYRELADPCTCPPDFPQCVCGKEPVIKIITRRPVTPGERELQANPRSRSARLRVAEKI